MVDALAGFSERSGLWAIVLAAMSPIIAGAILPIRAIVIGLSLSSVALTLTVETLNEK